jgi:PAS domain S-box-containing protein
VQIDIPSYARGSATWLRAAQGSLESLPTLLGLPCAQVTADITDHRGVFHVTSPESRLRLGARLRAWLRDPAIAELERQVEELRRIDQERSLLENALRERERMLSNLIANLSGMVYRCSGPGWTFEFASERSLELTGYAPDELATRCMSSLALVHPDDVEMVREWRRDTLANQSALALEYRIRTREGAARWVMDVARRVCDEGGRELGIEGFLADVTGRKRLEEELGQARRVEGIGRLAGGVAHDFNNLLTVILGSTELAALELPPSSPVSKHVDQIREAGQRAAALTRQLLAFARKQVIQPRVVNLNALVRGMSTLLVRTLVANIQLDYRLATEPWNVEIDPGQFEQVLLNLVINASDAMPQGGRLTIETANTVVEESCDRLPGLVPGCYVMLRVSDTGVGMSEEVQRNAFEPFFTTKEVGKGTGLGLASVHGIVRQAHGHIFLTSELERGTQLTIYLSRSTEASVETEAESSRAPRRASHESVLVVEDHDLVRGMIVHTLETHGYKVIAAASSTQALQIAASLPKGPDLLVTDLVMPHMSGVELGAKLRVERPELPVLYMSGYSEHDMSLEMQAPSPTGFLQKPFASTTLLERVCSLLDSTRRETPTGLTKRAVLTQA